MKHIFTITNPHFVQNFIQHFSVDRNRKFSKVSFPFESVRVKFDSGVIFLNHSQFFATHSNQWDCFILYRQQITSNGFLRFRQRGPAFE